MSPRTIRRWVLTAPRQPLVLVDAEVGPLDPGEVLVRVAGCGVCHTDLGFFLGEVKPNAPLPLALGHEISGRVVAAGDAFRHLVEKAVVVPAVIPCGTCALCRQGREGICRAQIMPGNDAHGGFASHVRVPGRDLLVLEEPLRGHELWELAVIADAVSTPYQAAVRAEVAPGDTVVVVGAGGIGGFGVQIAAALGATVVAVDVDRARLALAAEHGAAATADVHGLGDEEARKAVRAALQRVEAPPTGLKVLEMSGSTGGQRLAWSLLNHGAVLVVVGFTREKVELRLGNLMAFDARAIGNWGCSPRHYPAVLELVRAGKVRLEPFIRREPMQEANRVFERVAAHAESRRVVLTNED